MEKKMMVESNIVIIGVEINPNLHPVIAEDGLISVFSYPSTHDNLSS